MVDRPKLIAAIDNGVEPNDEKGAPQPDDGDDHPGREELIRGVSEPDIKIPRRWSTKLTSFPKIYFEAYIGSGQRTQWPKNVAIAQYAAILPQYFNWSL